MFRISVSQLVSVHQSGACKILSLIGSAKFENGKTAFSPGRSARFGRVICDDQLSEHMCRSFIADAPPPYLHTSCI